ncbi:MAG TPA: M28 family peptidase, partial [Allocoleopsis sp.]
MSKRWIWLGLFLTAIAIVLLGWRGVPWLSGEATPSFQETRPLDRASVAPSLEAERIFADVKALAFPRYTDADRSRARDYIAKALEQAGWTPQTQPFADGINLYAKRSGTDPEAGTILLAAHYDTVETSPGADDNATSVATVLEAARILGKRSTAAT